MHLHLVANEHLMCHVEKDEYGEDRGDMSKRMHSFARGKIGDAY